MNMSGDSEGLCEPLQGYANSESNFTALILPELQLT